jgi:hypothetical protein
MPERAHTSLEPYAGSSSLSGRRFGDLEAYDHLAGRDAWCCDGYVWQILGQPRSGNTS